MDNSRVKVEADIFRIKKLKIYDEFYRLKKNSLVFCSLYQTSSQFECSFIDSIEGRGRSMLYRPLNVMG